MPRDSRKSVCNVGQPVANFTRTETFQKVRAVASAHNNSNAILHCYGFPGTGKSQIMRMLAKEFPFRPSNVNVKWHIECVNEQSIIASFKNLVGQLHSNRLTPSDAPLDSVSSDIDDNRSASFMKLLTSLKRPVLIVIEDIIKKNLKQSDLEFVRDFHRCLASSGTCSNSPIHLYIASRSQNSIFQQDEASQFFCGQEGIYKDFNVTGFTQNEAVDYLFSDSTLERCESSAIQIFNRFSGSPLGLRAAKAYCREAMITYHEYMSTLENDELAVQIDEAELITLDFGTGTTVQHIFHAITMPFIPESDNDVKALQRWRVLTCLSYLHFSDVPRFLIERFCQYFRRIEVRNATNKNKTDAGFIISKLKSNELCVVEGQDVSFHEVALHAFRVIKKLNWNSDFNPLICAVEVLASATSKVRRNEKYTAQTMKLVRHLHYLLQHVERERAQLPTDVMFKLLLVHVHEVFGAIACTKSLGYKEACEKRLKVAFEIILVEIGEAVTEFQDFVRTFRHRETSQLAERLTESCFTAGQVLEQGFIDRYLSKVLVLRHTSKDFQFLQRECLPEKKSDFETLKAKLEKNPAISVDVIQTLRACGVFMSEVDFLNIVFTERLASTLQYLAELVTKNNPTPALLRERLWMSQLSHEISLKCRERFGTGILFEHLSRIRGTVPIILLLSKREEGLENDHLNFAKEMCERAIEHSTGPSYPLYVQGVLKEVGGGVYQTMTIKMQLLRVYTRIVRGNPDQEFLRNGRRFCDDILQLASENTDELIAYRCIVYCGKFFAAIGEHDRAIECCDKYIEERKVHTDYSEWAWAVCNFGYSVMGGGRRQLYGKALRLCQEVVRSGEQITQQLRNKIVELASSLQNVSYE